MAVAIREKTKRLPSVLPPAQALALFEQQARELAGMPAEQFLARWDAGKYRDLPDTPHGRKIAYLALLIPFGRRHP